MCNELDYWQKAVWSVFYVYGNKISYSNLEILNKEISMIEDKF